LRLVLLVFEAARNDFSVDPLTVIPLPSLAGVQ
jgi:hypothetical protein